MPTIEDLRRDSLSTIRYDIAHHAYRIDDSLRLPIRNIIGDVLGLEDPSSRSNLTLYARRRNPLGSQKDGPEGLKRHLTFERLDVSLSCGFVDRTCGSDVLATVQPAYTAEGGLRITSGEFEPMMVDPPGASHVTLTPHFGVPVPGWDAGDAPAGWFSDLLGEPVRLVAMEHDVGWRLPEEFDIFDQPAAFADAAPLLVASETSLQWLVERASEPFGMDRFRPNIIIDGTDPWEEDTWVDFTIGEARLRGHTPWPRCAIPQIDQKTAERHKEPARVLRKHRWCADASTLPKEFGSLVSGNGLFGLACSIGPVGAQVGIGDVVTVETRTSPLLRMR